MYPGVMLGTPGYIAPEQAHGVPDVDARADVFSLGCVLFRCISGRAPFHGKDALSVLLKVAAEDPPRLRELRPGIPADRDELVARMLSKRREERPADGAAVVEALRAIGEAGPLSNSVISIRGVPVELTTVERRVMSLVLVSRTGADPERTLPVSESDERERSIRAVAERHQGKLEILVDGSFLILLAGAEAATDLVARAAGCALGLRALLDAAPGGQPTHAKPPAEPVVIVSGRELLGPRLPTGDLIDRAVELARSASERSSIRIDDVTAGLLGPDFDVEVDGTAFCLRGVGGEPDGRRMLLGKPTAYVGRERELVQLESLFDQCVEERMATAVLVTAPAGMGKSRLVHEFYRKRVQSAGGVEVLSGRGDSMSAGSAFGLLARALRGAAEILDGEPIEVRRSKLRARVGRHLGAGAEMVAVLLGELVGTALVDEGDAHHASILALRQNPVLLGEEMRRAFLTFLRAECVAQPVLLILEDLHWGDLPTVRFVDSALDELRDARLMVLAAARPEVHVLFPRCWAARGAQEIRLRPLSRRAGEKLVRQVLGDAVGADTMEMLLDRADGHAFYLEELIRAVAAGKGAVLPETVLAMVQARLEQLDSSTRRALRAASVFGETFWKGGVEALLNDAEASDWLAELCDKEVIAVHEPGRFPGETEYRFRHAMVREAAYGMLAEGDRVLGHRLVGEWLEQAGEPNPMLLAEHLERGNAPERAVVWFRRAAAQALEGGDLDAVVARTRRALECGATGPNRGALLGMQGYVHIWRTEYAEAAARYREALVELPRNGFDWHVAIGGALYASASIGDHDRVAEMLAVLEAGLREPAERLMPGPGMSEAVPVLCVAGRYDLARGYIDRFCADMDGVSSIDVDTGRCHYVFFADADPWRLYGCATALLERGERSAEPRTIHMAQAYQGVALVKLGVVEAGEDLLRLARAGARSHRLHLIAQFANICLADSLTNRQQLDEAEALLVECEVHEEQSAFWSAVRCISWARVAGQRRDAERARVAVDSALSECGPLSPGYGAQATAILSTVVLELEGDPPRAAALARESLRRLDEVGTWCYDVAIRVNCADVLASAGDRASAERALAVACAQIEARAAGIDDPARRESFLAGVPENAHARALARAWKS
jgi:hypothetical protein